MRKQKLTDLLPLAFAEVITAVVEFADPALDGRASELVWDPITGRWIPSGTLAG
ncbi:MAG: hypothetical protein RLZZ450_860 [Pseudomonadota bacterium]